MNLNLTLWTVSNVWSIKETFVTTKNSSEEVINVVIKDILFVRLKKSAVCSSSLMALHITLTHFSRFTIIMRNIKRNLLEAQLIWALNDHRKPLNMNFNQFSEAVFVLRSTLASTSFKLRK